MFGYVTVCEPELKVKDLKKYRAYYCGLCRTLKEDYGFMGQMTLTYDMTFAVILLSSLYERIPELEKHRCKIHPVKKQMMQRNEITSYAAAMNVLLAYYHMEDDWQDEKKFGRHLYGSVLKVKSIKKRNKMTGCTSSACKPRKIRFERFALPDNNASIHWKGVKTEDCSTTDLTRLYVSL